MGITYKKKVMLIVPHLQNGGQEKVCALTADLLMKDYDVQIVLFDNRNIMYHTNAKIVNINLPAERQEIFCRVLRVIRRCQLIKKIKKDENITHSISFGESANLVNVLSKYRDETISGIHGNLQMVSKITNKIVIPFSDKIIAVSQEMEYELKKRFPNRQIVCISNPVDVEDIQKKGRNTCKTAVKVHMFKLFTMGRIVWEKGYWHLLKACSCLCKRGYDIELIHAGIGDVEPYKRLAKDLQIDDRVTFKGQLENPFCELRDADVFVLSSCSEGLSNVILEAMAMGVPVVSTNCKVGPAGILHSNWQEAVSHRSEVFMADYGILAPEVGRDENMNADEIEKDDLMLADAIEVMLKSDRVRSTYEKQGLIRVKDFDKSVYLESIKKCLC